MHKIIIIGAGVHAKVIQEIFSHHKNSLVVGFTDIIQSKKGNKLHGVPILGDDSMIPELMEDNLINSTILGLGYKLIKQREVVFKSLESKQINFINAIHPSAVIAKDAQLGEGIAVMANATINTDSIIKGNVVVNTGAIIDHDNKIGENTFIQVGAKLAGNVSIGKNTVIGMGANILENLTIGSNTIIGAGSVVTKNIGSNVIYKGVPARYFKKNY